MELMFLLVVVIEDSYSDIQHTLFCVVFVERGVYPILLTCEEQVLRLGRFVR